MKSKVISRKDIFKHRFIHLEEANIEVDKYNGGRMNIQRMALIRPKVVGVLLYNPTEKAIVLIEQFRYSALEITGGWVQEIVAGVMDKTDESPAVCARRECMEESGYSPERIEQIQMFMPSVGISNQQLILFYAEVGRDDRVSPGGGLEEEDEDIKVVEVPLAEIREELAAGKIFDVKTLVALQWFFLFKQPAA